MNFAPQTYLRFEVSFDHPSKSFRIFTALHEMQTQSIAMRILSVIPSVGLTVEHVDCDKMGEKSVQIFIQYERTFSLVF